jgi:hypothetical protein
MACGCSNQQQLPSEGVMSSSHTSTLHRDHLIIVAWLGACIKAWWLGAGSSRVGPL